MSLIYSRIFDLSSGLVPESFEADICIVGSGTVGLFLAHLLNKRNANFLLLDAGPLKPVSTESIGYLPDFSSSVYSGATEGRYFGLGGSSSRWGGALIPHSSFDLREGDESESDTTNTWNFILNSIEENQQNVLSSFDFSYDPLFCLTSIPFTECSLHKALAGSGLSLWQSLILPFSQKNFIRFAEGNTTNSQSTLIYNASVSAWQFFPGDSAGLRISSVNAVSLNHKKVQVKAKRYIICSGAIESARILLEISAQSNGAYSAEDNEVGRYLSDHLSLPIARVDPIEVPRVVSLFSPTFQGSFLRNYRFLLKPESANLPRSFSHFVFRQKDESFYVAKQILASIQSRQLPSISAAQTAQSIFGLARLAGNKLINSRLHIPPNTPCDFCIDVEQEKSYTNAVTLTSKRDKFNRLVANINWGISLSDKSNINKLSSLYLDAWARSSTLPNLNTLPFPTNIAENSASYDAYHPTATTRMGNSKLSVVDLNLKVRKFENLWSSSTGVLPSPGTANPTFSVLCLTAKLANALCPE
ncbi:GMC oxidoreductase family protein [Synechococcus sp. Minos11]|uniref:GMC oxidoreductase n=1 Tax=Synechococcus sp. Minos11 TaxID=221341 RepID=UPI001647A0D1|nr:GMC oxidoreductase [Synechococcus sp. Minos11]QNJ08132.1 GMC oxidoreductase family protein [Synechococcus sp. Minos11]